MRRPLAGIFSACLWGLGCHRELPAPSSSPPQEILSLSLQNKMRGQLQWDLRAARSELQLQARRAEFQGPQVRFFEAGKKLSEIESQEGSMDWETRDLLFRKRVRLRSYTKNLLLETEELRYLSRTDRLYSEKPVRILHNRLLTRGEALEASVDLSEILIRENKSEMSSDSGPSEPWN
ncbi:MAG: LPS export ABC transporter periplasmic protein LptC [Elusimicrobia bacterium]|nr:LPS export ABC transporter periplasmic protein LptC [Elusimicrobiota bacterium]